MLAQIREEIPTVAVTSDFIVGFCGETEEDFDLTCKLVRESQFKNSFIFKYSERPGTKGADNYPDDIPAQVKKDRNNKLLAIQNSISEETNQQKIGCEYEVLVEGPSKSARKQENNGDRLQLMGRTMTDDIVVFDGNLRQMGQLLPITIYDANAFTLFGEVRTQHVGPEVYSLSPESTT
jgi:tRNA-2-methylthio-N6-dimethylallyladenosine synthase